MNRPVQPAPFRITPAQMQRFFEFASDLFVVLDAATLIVRAANPALARTVGAPIEAIVGRCALEFALPEDGPALLEDVALLRRTGELALRDRRLVTVGGDVRWLRFRATLDPHEAVFCIVATDVTAEYGEVAQRAERARASAALDAAGVGVCDWDLPTGAMTWNASTYRLLGLAPDEAPASLHTYLQRVHPLDRERVLATFEGLGPETRAFDHAYRIVRPDGEVRWLRGPARVERDAAGQPRCILSLLFDVTEAERARRAAEEAGERMRLARQAGQLALFELDVHTDALTWDVPEGFLADAGDCPLPASGADLFGWLHPDDRPQAAASLGRLREGGCACHCEVRVLTPAGRQRWLRLHAVPGTPASGACLRIVGVVRDITAERLAAEALQASEARARLAMETAGLGLWDWNPLTDAIDWDARFAGDWGPFVDRPGTAAAVFDRVHPDDRAPLRAALEHTLRTGEPLHATCRYREPDGTERWVVTHGRRYRAGGGMHVLGADMDATAFKRAEQAALVSEAKYRGLFAWSHDPSVVIDPDTLEILEINQAACELYGYAEHELLGRPATILGPVSADYRERAARGEAYRAMREHRRRDGTPLQVEVSVATFALDGRRLIIASARDHTERERTREALQALAVGTAAVGRAFFADLTRELCRALQVDAAMVARVDRTARTARIIAGHGLLAGSAGVDYALAGTPCENVAGNETCFQSGGVARDYPDDALLVDLAIDSYLGTPLQGSDGTVIGLLVVLNRRPIDERHEPVRILEIFANRAAAELERLAAEDALRESEERLRGLIEASLEAVLIFDPQSLEIVDVNPALTRLYGYRREDLLGRSGALLSATPETSAETVARFEPHIARRLHRRRDGTLFPAEISLARFRAGGRQLAAAIMRDISGRERAREALEALAAGTTAVGQAFFESLVRELCKALRVDGALVGRLLPGEPQTVRILSGHGLFAGSDGLQYPLAGTPCATTIDGAVCFVRGGATGRYPRDRVLADLGIDSYLGAPLRSADGRVIGLLAVQHRGLIDEAVDPVRILEIFAGHAASELERLATEEALRNSEAHYRTLFETVHDPLFIVDLTTLTFADVNPAACEVYGYAREELLGADVRLVSAEPEATLAALRGLASFTARRRHRRADGREFPVEITTRRYTLGTRTLTATVVRDVSERERSQAVLEALAAGTTATGQDFFEALVRELSRAMDVRGAYVTMPMAGDRGRAMTVAGWLDGEPGVPLEYPLAGTPCGAVLLSGEELRLDDLRATYPESPAALLGTSSYLGVPIRAADGRTIATLALLDDRPIATNAQTREVIRIFAARAAAELDRVAAETALRSSEARYRGLFETIRDPVFVIDAGTFTIVDVNPAAATVYGYDREAMIGMPGEAVSAEPDESRWAILNLESYMASRRHRRADGTEFAVEIATRRYAGGEQPLAVSIARDVSERERAQQALRDTVSTLRATLEATADGIFVVDRERRITAWNRRFQDFYRIPDATLAAGDAREVPRLAAPLMVDPAGYLARTEEIYARPDTVAWDTLALANGLILERYTQPQVRDGAIIGRVWSFRDITARVEAERRRAMTQSALDNSPEAVVFVVPLGAIVYANAAAARLLGRERDALLGMTPLDYEVGYTTDVREALTVQVREARYAVREIEVRRGDGTVVPVEATTHYIEHGDSGFFCTFLRDVTERRDAQRRLRLAAAELALAEERSRKQLSRDLHDHVVQDLALIKMNLGALGRPRSRARAAIFDELRAQLDKTVREARTLMFEISPPVLYDLGLQPAIEWLAERFTRDTGIPCVLLCEPPMVRLPVDTEVLLFQIVRELLANVRKHAGAARVRIACGIESEGYVVEVADNGRGMAPPGSDARAAAERGFGLLHIHDRLDLLGGRLLAESSAGSGTAVRVTVPFPAPAGLKAAGTA